MRKFSVLGKSAFIACVFAVLAGCASSPVTIGTKDVNANVMKNSLAPDGSLNKTFIARYNKLKPGMHRKDAFVAIGLSESASQTQLTSEDLRRILYGDPKMATFEEAEKLRAHVSTLCGTSIPLESSKKSLYLTSPLFVGTTSTGYRVWIDMIFKCGTDELYFAQWRGSERLESGEKAAIWLFLSSPASAPVPAIKLN